MSPPTAERSGRRFHLVEGMALVAGVAVALGLFNQPLRELFDRPGGESPPFLGMIDTVVYFSLVVLLGGLSFMGVPMLLIERFGRDPRPAWGEGKTLWFATGLSAWLLWPPVIARRGTGGNRIGEGVSELCFLYGTPLMALYMVWALWAGGRLRRARRRRQAARSWRERFGLILGLIWACTGLYMLALIYRQEFFRR